MKFEFKIKNKTLERTDTNVLTNDIQEDIFCHFSFVTDEWKNKEKYVIFWDKENKTQIISIGKKMNSKCIVPKEITQKSVFIIQIYCNNDLFTQKLNIATVPPVIQDNPSKNKCHIETQINDEYNIKKIFKNLFEELDSKVDNIKYENGYLKCFSKNKIVYSAPIFNNIVDDLKEVLKEMNNIDNIILEEDNVICYSKNEIIHNIPFSSTLSNIAFSGDYNDLENIPTEFEPKHHNHVVVDVVDYEENIGFDLNTLLDFLGDEINKE